MYFTVNTGFVNYLGQIDNLTETLKVPILMNKTTFEQTLPISLNASKFDSELLSASEALTDFIHQYKCKKEIFELKERHDNTDTNLPNTNFFSNNFIVDVFSVITAYCNNFNIGYNFDNIFTMYTQETQNASNQSCFIANERSRCSNRQEDVTTTCTCKIQFYIILALSISIFTLVIFAVLHSRKLKLCKGHLFSNAVKLMLFISDVQYYVPIKLCKTAGSTHLF